MTWLRQGSHGRSSWSAVPVDQKAWLAAMLEVGAEGIAAWEDIVAEAEANGGSRYPYSYRFRVRRGLDDCHRLQGLRQNQI